MTTSEDEETERPLDPATERVRRKMTRLLVVSIGIMLVGVMAVLGAIVYKLSGPKDWAALGRDGEPRELSLALPAGTRILDTALDGDRALLRVSQAGEEALLLIDLPTGRVLVRYRIATGE